jgi:hypothetical protein
MLLQFAGNLILGKYKKNPTPYKRALLEEPLMPQLLWDQLQEKMWNWEQSKHISHNFEK